MFEFRYEPKFEDYLFLNRHVQRPHLRRSAVIVVVIIAVLVAINFLPGRNAEADNSNFWLTVLPLFIVVPLVIGAFVFGIGRAARKRWDAAEELRVPRDYEISEEGVRMMGGSISLFLEWRYFIQAELANGFVLLKTAQNQYQYFPSSAVQDFDAFQKLVSRHVKVTKNWNVGAEASQ
jgi:hypothetical protein